MYVPVKVERSCPRVSTHRLPEDMEIPITMNRHKSGRSYMQVWFDCSWYLSLLNTILVCFARAKPDHDVDHEDGGFFVAGHIRNQRKYRGS